MDRLKNLSILYALLIASSLAAQQGTATISEVSNAYRAGKFEKALDVGRQLLKVHSGNAELLFYAGESARRLRYYPTAEIFLEKIPPESKVGLLSETDFFIGQTKKSLGRYQQAVKFYEKYLLTHEDETDLLVHLAKDEINHCNWVLSKLSEKDNGLFNVSSLGDNVNSEYSEVAPLRYADKMYFTAIYPDKKNKVNVSRIYSAIKDHKARVESFNPTNDGLHAAHVALMPDASKLYYTICKEIEKTNELRCEIWSRDRLYEGGWGPPVKLPRQVNYRGSTMLHPTVGWDMYLKAYVLYFSSDRPGGEGGLDIWGTIIKEKGVYGVPFNAPFNSRQDEVTPFFHMPSQTIFYSSNGLKGVGGFDVYRAVKVGEAQWELPVNMGEPLNTKFDEYYYSYHTRTGRGYLASNRTCKEQNPNTNNCQTDIFDAEIFAELRLMAYNGITETRLYLPNVTVMDLNQGTLKVLTPDATGQYFSCRVPADRLHHLAVFADGYRPARIVVTTKNLPYSETLKKEVYLFEGEATAQEQQELDQYFEKAGIGTGDPEVEALRVRLNSKVVKP